MHLFAAKSHNNYSPLHVSVERHGEDIQSRADPVFDGVGLEGFKIRADDFLLA